MEIRVLLGEGLGFFFGTRVLGLGMKVWVLGLGFWAWSMGMKLGGRVYRDLTGLGGWALELRLKGFLTNSGGENSDSKP